MANSNFQEVTKRLLLALAMDKETDLGQRLGFKQSTWAQRKLRGSLPTEQIDALIAQEAINPEYVYNGTGSVYEGAGWAHEYKARAASLRLAKAYLTPLGHAVALVDALTKMDANDGYKSTAYKFITALRDAYKINEYDLTFLITGVDTHQADDVSSITPLSKEEHELIEIYQSATKQGQAFIRRAASMSADKPAPSKTKQTAGARSVQIAGSLASVNTINTGTLSTPPPKKPYASQR